MSKTDQESAARVDDWLRAVEFEIDCDAFEKLPTHPDYRYEYFDGRAYLSPRPKGFSAHLNLAEAKPPDEAGLRGDCPIRPLREADWEPLQSTFSLAFARTEPFACLDDAERGEAARQLLEAVRTGGEGPLVEPACFVAEAERGSGLAGAILITLYPDKPASEWDPRQWEEPPPDDAVAQKIGRPHLTWIFVSLWEIGRGIGSSLLANAAGELRKLGYQRLATSFYAGNSRSALWHWRNGFELAEYAGSMRAMHRKIAEEDAVGED